MNRDILIKELVNIWGFNPYDDIINNVNMDSKTELTPTCKMCGMPVEGTVQELLARKEKVGHYCDGCMTDEKPPKRRIVVHTEYTKEDEVFRNFVDALRNNYGFSPGYDLVDTLYTEYCYPDQTKTYKPYGFIKVCNKSDPTIIVKCRCCNTEFETSPRMLFKESNWKVKPKDHEEIFRPFCPTCHPDIIEHGYPKTGFDRFEKSLKRVFLKSGISHPYEWGTKEQLLFLGLRNPWKLYCQKHSGSLIDVAFANELILSAPSTVCKKCIEEDLSTIINEEAELKKLEAELEEEQNLVESETEVEIAPSKTEVEETISLDILDEDDTENITDKIDKIEEEEIVKLEPTEERGTFEEDEDEDFDDNEWMDNGEENTYTLGVDKEHYPSLEIEVVDEDLIEDENALEDEKSPAIESKIDEVKTNEDFINDDDGINIDDNDEEIALNIAEEISEEEIIETKIEEESVVLNTIDDNSELVETAKDSEIEPQINESVITIDLKFNDEFDVCENQNELVKKFNKVTSESKIESPIKVESEITYSININEPELDHIDSAIEEQSVQQNNTNTNEVIDDFNPFASTNGIDSGLPSADEQFGKKEESVVDTNHKIKDEEISLEINAKKVIDQAVTDAANLLNGSEYAKGTKPPRATENKPRKINRVVIRKAPVINSTNNFDQQNAQSVKSNPQMKTSVKHEQSKTKGNEKTMGNNGNDNKDMRELANIFKDSKSMLDKVSSTSANVINTIFAGALDPLLDACGIKIKYSARAAREIDGTIIDFVSADSKKPEQQQQNQFGFGMNQYTGFSANRDVLLRIFVVNKESRAMIEGVQHALLRRAIADTKQINPQNPILVKNRTSQILAAYDPSYTNGELQTTDTLVLYDDVIEYKTQDIVRVVVKLLNAKISENNENDTMSLEGLDGLQTIYSRDQRFTGSIKDFVKAHSLNVAKIPATDTIALMVPNPEAQNQFGGYSPQGYGYQPQMGMGYSPQGYGMQQPMMNQGYPQQGYGMQQPMMNQGYPQQGYGMQQPQMGYDPYGGSQNNMPNPNIDHGMPNAQQSAPTIEGEVIDNEVVSEHDLAPNVMIDSFGYPLEPVNYNMPAINSMNYYQDPNKVLAAIRYNMVQDQYGQYSIEIVQYVEPCRMRIEGAFEMLISQLMQMTQRITYAFDLELGTEYTVASRSFDFDLNDYRRTDNAFNFIVSPHLRSDGSKRYFPELFSPRSFYNASPDNAEICEREGVSVEAVESGERDAIIKYNRAITSAGYIRTSHPGKLKGYLNPMKFNRQLQLLNQVEVDKFIDKLLAAGKVLKEDIEVTILDDKSEPIIETVNTSELVKENLTPQLMGTIIGILMSKNFPISVPQAAWPMIDMSTVEISGNNMNNGQGSAVNYMNQLTGNNFGGAQGFGNPAMGQMGQGMGNPAMGQGYGMGQMGQGFGNPAMGQMGQGMGNPAMGQGYGMGQGMGNPAMGQMGQGYGNPAMGQMGQGFGMQQPYQPQMNTPQNPYGPTGQVQNPHQMFGGVMNGGYGQPQQNGYQGYYNAPNTQQAGYGMQQPVMGGQHFNGPAMNTPHYM